MRLMLILAVLCPLLSPGQTHKTTPLSIGDTVPDIHLSNIINYKTSSTHLSSFKGKLIILDFFATWCSSCIEVLPKLDRLQKNFGSQLQVVLVSYESLQKISALRKKSKVFAACSLPVVYADTALHQRFPRKFIPHEVWIDPRGRVAAITDAAEVTEDNLQAILSGAPVNLPLKRDILDFKPGMPFLQNPYMTSQLRYGSAFAGYIKNIGSAQGRSTQGASSRYYFINRPLLGLYQKTCGVAPNRLVLELKHHERFSKAGQNNENWKEQNLVCYELTVPSATSPSLVHSMMRQDLDRFSGLHGRTENRLTPCWILACNGTPAPTTGAEAFIGPDSTGSYMLFTNQPLTALLETLNIQGFPIIINETGLSYNTDLRLPPEAFQSVSALSQSLAPYGLTLIPAERELDLFILSDGPPPNEDKKTINANEKPKSSHLQWPERPEPAFCIRPNRGKEKIENSKSDSSKKP